MNKIITLLFCLLLPAYALTDTLTGKVIKITDGDTVHILLNNHTKEKIRLVLMHLRESNDMARKLNSI